jgi:small subunit ribosomal protein S20
VATHASALKAHRQSLQHRERNRQLRTKLRAALKTVRESITPTAAGDAQARIKETVSLIDRMVSKGIIHRNTAARYKSRLQARVRRTA